MTDWPVKTLGEVCEVVNGATPDTKVVKYWGGSHAWITPAEMGNLNSPFLSMSRRTLSDEGLASCSAALVPPKTVILSSRAPIGYLVINEVPMATNQGCKSLIPRKGLHFNFLYYYLKANVELLDSLGTGTTFKELSGTQLKTVEIPVPPLEEQNRLVELLDAATARIAELTACYEQARTHANNFFTSALRDALEGNADLPFITLGEVCSINSVLIDPKDSKYSGMNHIGAGNIEAGTGRLFDIKTASEENLISGKFLFSANDVLYSKIRPYLVKVATPEESGLCSADVYPLSPGPSLTRMFLFYSLISETFTKYAISGSSRTGMPKVNRQHLFKYEMRIPPVVVQMELVRRLEAVRSKTSEMISAYDAKLTAAKNLRQSILEAAFIGQM